MRAGSLVGHRDAGPQRSEPDAVREGDGERSRGRLHQDPHRRRIHPALGPQDTLVPVRKEPVQISQHALGGEAFQSGSSMSLPTSHPTSWIKVFHY